MTTTTYHCDRCKKQLETQRELITLKLTVNCGYGDSSSAIAPQEWCRECCISTGFVRWSTEEKVSLPEQSPTLEDFLRNMIQQEIQNT
jgi:DNA-directed RNA polymerase subunit RPC12/RpoP